MRQHPLNLRHSLTLTLSPSLTQMGKALSNTTLGPLSRSVITGLACGSANFGLDAIQELRRMAILTQSLKEKENGTH